MQIQYNKSPDKEKIEAIISAFTENRHSVEYFMRGIQRNIPICCFEAYDEREIVGVITAWRTHFHPYCTYFSVIVNPLYSHEQVEMKLLQHVRSFQGVLLPLQTSVWETDHRLRSFYEQAGFEEIRRTYSPSLKLHSLSISNGDLTDIERAEHLTVRSLDEVMNNAELKSQLIILVRDTYQKTHTANPVGIVDLDYWEELIFAEDILLEGSYMALNGCEIKSFALLHESSDATKLELGWRGIRDQSDMRILLMLTANQISYAKDSGYTYLDAEIDTTDPYALEILGCFPFAPSPALITYQLRSSSTIRAGSEK